MSIDRVIRTFHPIGQGAFYSERLFEEENEYNIVYDCGVLRANSDHKAIVRGAFSKKDIIDFLFISHLDDDHISLVKTLKDTVGCLKRVVLPFISQRDVEVLNSLSSSFSSSDIYSFWKSVNNAFDGENIEEDSPRFYFILPERDNNHFETRYVETKNSGFPFSVVTDWVFIPFCIHSERQTELDKNLSLLLSDKEFVEVLKGFGYDSPSLEDLKSLLTSDRFVDLIGDKGIAKKLHDAYSNITGSINQNSLLVYSGPSSVSDDFRLSIPHSRFINCGYYRHACFFDCIDHRVACLYTGDSDFSMTYYKWSLNSLWDNIGTIQIPHHGSYHSFKLSLNKQYSFDRPYYFPVSFGDKNSFHHPSGKVLSFLLNVGSIPIPVTDDYYSKFEQIITI